MAKMIVLVKKAKLISTHVIKMAGIIRQPAYLKLQTETLLPVILNLKVFI